MLGYTSEEVIEKYIGSSIDSSYSDQIDAWISQMEQYINKYTGRVFIADTSATVRYFDGKIRRDYSEIYIDENIDITEDILVYDCNGDLYYTLVEDTDFYTYPYNELPIRKVIIIPSTSKGFLSGIKNIKVTAKWGYSETVPPEIEFVTMVLTAGIINFSNNKTPSKVKSEKLGDYSISFRDDKHQNDYKRAMEILNNYCKPNV